MTPRVSIPDSDGRSQFARPNLVADQYTKLGCRKVAKGCKQWEVTE